jgi:MFS transporter, PAT family, solute carrier family 33 (acetyl-CoA transportor), member 1
LRAPDSRYSLSIDVRSFIVVHLVAKIGFQANEAVTGLKLVEKGFGKEDLALSVLIDFPFQLVLGYYAAKWSKGDNALRPWLWGFIARLAFAAINMAIVKGLPIPVTTPYFLLIIVTTVTGSFASTVQSVSNLGGTWPRFFVLKAVDYFTISECQVSKLSLLTTVGECTSDQGKAQCAAVGGSCHILRDGYYITSTVCVVIGTVLLVGYILPVCRRLQSLPAAAWRVKHGAGSHSE